MLGNVVTGGLPCGRRIAVATWCMNACSINVRPLNTWWATETRIPNDVAAATFAMLQQTQQRFGWRRPTDVRMDSQSLATANIFHEIINNMSDWRTLLPPARRLNALRIVGLQMYEQYRHVRFFVFSHSTIGGAIENNKNYFWRYTEKSRTG